MQSGSFDPEDGETTTPAVSILQSIERVAYVIANMLLKSRPSFTISRPNIGMAMYAHEVNTTTIFPICCMQHCVTLMKCLCLACTHCLSITSTAISGQQFSVNSLRTGIEFPSANIVVTLASFRYHGRLPQVHFPQSFLLAARRIGDPIGNLSMDRFNGTYV